MSKYDSKKPRLIVPRRFLDDGGDWLRQHHGFTDEKTWRERAIVLSSIRAAHEMNWGGFVPGHIADLLKKRKADVRRVLRDLVRHGYVDKKRPRPGVKLPSNVYVYRLTKKGHMLFSPGEGEFVITYKRLASFPRPTWTTISIALYVTTTKTASPARIATDLGLDQNTVKLMLWRAKKRRTVTQGTPGRGSTVTQGTPEGTQKGAGGQPPSRKLRVRPPATVPSP